MAMSSTSESTSALDGRALVLNKAFLPIHVTSVKRALGLLYRGVARAVDSEYRTFDYSGWSALPASGAGVGTVAGRLRVPRVVLLVGFERVPQRRVRFSRNNILQRDSNTCQYCGVRFPKTNLNLDHVMPKSLGGETSWENVVCSCLACNRRKGARQPKQAGMQLIRAPRQPQWTPFLAISGAIRERREWASFLPQHGD